VFSETYSRRTGFNLLENKLKLGLRVTALKLGLRRIFGDHNLSWYNYLMQYQKHNKLWSTGKRPNFTNRPKHISQDNSIYFITARTIDGMWFLKPDRYKQILFEKIKEKTSKFDSPLLAYVILNNHYHLIIKVEKANILPKFIKELNGASSLAINTAENVVGRKIWWNYFDHVIRDEADFYKHLNYIHQNPIKHGLSRNFDFKFSSYGSWLKKKGLEYLNQSFEKYPVVDFVVVGDEY